LRQLQDAVPPFDSDEARDILAKELNVPGGAAGLSTVFSKLSPEPLAAASIGQVSCHHLPSSPINSHHLPSSPIISPQVYKAELSDGRVVAVKVQRPNVLDEP
jgi:predicted unusual protein kinase regulating ubiquinone biosynthesis (AarF/ABC1/UbiB family)